MKIALASDHAGFELKERVRAFLDEKGIAYLDFGSGAGETVDYVDFGIRAMDSVVSGECDRAILFCGTGIGMSIVANKFKGIRAAVCWDRYTAEVSRRHNDANCLCLGGRVLEPVRALEIVAAWIDSPFEGGRHERRVAKISELEKRTFR
ncbi:MAG: ribose 5-phosphate isomerase B [Candidatus Aminicenantales bacterium]